MYCYHVIITSCYKVSDSWLKIVNIVFVQAFDWLSRNMMYYLCIGKCGCVGQINTMLVG